jgi:spermidine/putrescine transport system permease protein
LQEQKTDFEKITIFRNTQRAVMRIYAFVVYLFLYLPIALIIFFSFNSGRYAMSFEGFSTKWYGKALNNPFVMDALTASFTVALTSAILASVFGTMAALALQRISGWKKHFYDGLIYVAIMVPGIVIGISTLVALVTMFDFINPYLSFLAPLFGGEAPKLQLGFTSLIAAHTLFTMSLVIVILRARINGMDRSLIDASEDLYATPLTTFRLITLPQLMPGIVAAFLLSFTFSFDDFVIAFFVAGPNTTLPVYVFSSIRRGVTPEVNAIGTMVLVTSLVLLFSAQYLMNRKTKK